MVHTKISNECTWNLGNPSQYVAIVGQRKTVMAVGIKGVIARR